MVKYYLENENGQRYPMNIGGDAYLANAAGFGVSYATNFAAINDDGFFHKAKTKTGMPNIVGDLKFLSDGMRKYLQFVDFVENASVLYFVYDPDTNGTEYKREVEVGYITKTYRNQAGILTVPVSFGCKTPWFTETTLTGMGNVSVPAGGHIAPDIVVTANVSSYVNPQIVLTKDGSIFAQAKITDTQQGVSSLEYSNRYDDSHVTAVVGGQTVDLVQKLDTSVVVYGHEKGAFTIRVTDDNNIRPVINVVVRRYWRTV